MRRYCISDKYCQYKSDTGYCGYTAGCVLENVQTVKVLTNPNFRISQTVDVSTDSIEAIADAVIRKPKAEMERLKEQKTFSEMVHLHDDETHGVRLDTISRQAAVSRFSDLLMIELRGERLPTWDEVYNAMQELPSAQPERKKGKWIVRIRDNRAFFICSECNDEVDICGYGFCPNCGADMRGEKE